jgi:nitrous oxidase accessory protein NosD
LNIVIYQYPNSKEFSFLNGILFGVFLHKTIDAFLGGFRETGENEKTSCDLGFGFKILNLNLCRKKSF